MVLLLTPIILDIRMYCIRLSESNFKTIRPDQAKECNYYSTVLPLGPEGD
jgi:hypothetical protein